MNNFFKRIEIEGTDIQVGFANGKVDSGGIVNIPHGDQVDITKFNRNGDVYFCTGVDPKVKERCCDTDIKKRKHIAFDFDELKCEDFDRLKKALDNSSNFTDYSYIIFTGGGFHVHFIGNEVCIHDKNQFKRALQDLHNMIDEETGLKSDHNCVNVARLMRVPGCYSVKRSVEVKIMFESEVESNLLNMVTELGLEVKEVEKESKKEVGDFPINDIPVEDVFLKITNLDVTYDSATQKFKYNGKDKELACFVNHTGKNLIHWGGSDHIPKRTDGKEGYTPFHLVRTLLKLDSAGAFKWFEENYGINDHIGGKLEDMPKELPKPKVDFVITTGSELFEMKIKEFPYLIDKMVPENAITALTAESGKGKSILAMIMAKAIASGEDLFGEFKTTKCKTLIIDQEMDSDIIASRYQAIIGEPADIDYIYEQFWAIDDEAKYIWLMNAIKEHGYKFIVFDTLTMIHDKDENKSGDMKEINVKMLQMIAKTGVTILYLHHHRKPSQGEKQGMNSSRGTTEIIAKAASHLMLESSKETDLQGRIVDRMTIKQCKSRRPESITKIAVNVRYEKEEKKTYWEYDGLANDKGKSIDMCTDFVLSVLIDSNEYYSRDRLLKIAASDKKYYDSIAESNLKMACDDLIRDKRIESKTGKELKAMGMSEIDGKKINWNTIFYCQSDNISSQTEIIVETLKE